MKIINTILLTCIYGISLGQYRTNVVLKKQLDSVMILDQKYRDTLTLLMNPQNVDFVSKHLSYASGQATSYYWALQNWLDSLNVIFIDGIFKKFGYPGKSLVGAPSNESAWYIIQHSKKIHQYLQMMKKAAYNNELPFHLYAMMLDRDLMNQGKEQIYGSQGVCRRLKSGKNMVCFIWPIKDAKTVNQRRKKAGFEQTVEQNAARIGMVYKVFKIDEVK